MATATMRLKLNGAFSDCAVFWHVWPHRAVVDREVRQVGFELELMASHSPDPAHLDPGCPQCHRVRSALLAVAEHCADQLFPNLPEPVTCDIDPHSASVVCPAGLGNRACVTVSVVVTHRKALARGTNVPENFALDGVRRFMAELGIAER